MERRHVVAKRDEIADRSGMTVTVEGRSIGIFRVDDSYYGLLNRCVHQGGPVCEGGLFPYHGARVDTTRDRVKEYLDDQRMVVACPWHGWEFDVQTGRCLADPSRGIPAFRVELDGDDIVLVLEVQEPNVVRS